MAHGVLVRNTPCPWLLLIGHICFSSAEHCLSWLCCICSSIAFIDGFWTLVGLRFLHHVKCFTGCKVNYILTLVVVWKYWHVDSSKPCVFVQTKVVLYLVCDSSMYESVSLVVHVLWCPYALLHPQGVVVWTTGNSTMLNQFYTGSQLWGTCYQLLCVHSRRVYSPIWYTHQMLICGFLWQMK